MNKEQIAAAHGHSMSNQNSLAKSRRCGCFYCLHIFDPAEITDWIPDKHGPTAMCPYCGIDSVIGEDSGYPITEAFLKDMKEYWF